MGIPAIGPPFSRPSKDDVEPGAKFYIIMIAALLVGVVGIFVAAKGLTSGDSERLIERRLSIAFCLERIGPVPDAVEYCEALERAAPYRDSSR